MVKANSVNKHFVEISVVMMKNNLIEVYINVTSYRF